MSILGSLFKVGASVLGSGSAKKASRTAQAQQIAGLKQAQTTLNNQFDTATELASPWTQGGASAQAALLELLGLGTPGTAGTAGTPDYAAYVQANPDLLADFQKVAGRFGNDMGAYGEYHFNTYGQNEGRALPTTGGTAATPATMGNQAAAIAALKESPVYKALFGNAVDTTLANASATSGLRGGNTQDALARVGSDTLAKVYSDRIAQLGAVSGAGLGAVGNIQGLGADNAAAIAALFGKQGDVNAGGTLQRSAINSKMLDTLASEAGKIADGDGLGKMLGKIF